MSTIDKINEYLRGDADYDHRQLLREARDQIAGFEVVECGGCAPPVLAGVKSIQWIKPESPETLPPGASAHWFSPDVWLALSDGQVVMGCCLHRTADATHDELVHDWFANHPEHGSSSLDCDYWNGTEVVAWSTIESPKHPEGCA